MTINHVRPALLCLLLAWGGIAGAQVLQSVSFETSYNDMIEVRYYLLADAAGESYSVRILFSENGGVSFSEARSVSGDVGVVAGSGWKFVRWDVLNDRDALETNRLVMKVVASGTRGIGGFLQDAFFGSVGVRHQNDGMTMWGGYNVQRFRNPAFKQAFSAQVVRAGTGYNAGLRYVFLPLFIDGAYGHEEYSVAGLSPEDAKITLHAVSIALSTAVLPVIRYVIPTAGIGYQISWLEANAGGTGNTTPILSVSAPFWQVGLNVPLTPGLVLGATYRESVQLGGLSKGVGRGWYQWSISGGFHFGNP